ncbi:MAG TPA: hypothetical protein VFV89_21835 [Nocardioides sp.]|uniref:hypothetical protein n=1 Tax=Nocardioides sp. TaxID=35761 RepID=UPI002E35898C|nr:hypothetical protein [Nocardioides sp.]HEX5090466.1 hypothetical protein [Nocardioides sp.]
MAGKRLRSAAIGLFVLVPSLALAAWPALGQWADGVRRTSATSPVLKHHAHDAVWTGGIRITGTVQVPLTPGISSPVSIRINNPNPKTVAMQRVRVKIASISAPHADATHRCTRSDFVIRQMPRLALRVPAGRVVDLTALGVPYASWPTLGMRNLPQNQDGCKGATLTLRFRAARLGGQPR